MSGQEKLREDVNFMRIALQEAQKAWSKGEVPVGAVIVDEQGQIVARGFNQSLSLHDPSAHAEIVALRAAGRQKGNYRLPGMTLYVTLEPCPMCLGAMVQARIKRLVYGAADPKGGAVSSIMKFPFEKMNHRLEIESGLLEQECAEILQNFFRERRG
ncbi:MAG TPA: tRNA adenosine(34) deaminase TadA [Candidatus Aminicenantes bacterium]|nr:tRNA adenosine(34) deaminase TadA [Candidatus Aminicenantes bacterium]